MCLFIFEPIMFMCMYVFLYMCMLSVYVFIHVQVIIHQGLHILDRAHPLSGKEFYL